MTTDREKRLSRLNLMGMYSQMDIRATLKKDLVEKEPTDYPKGPVLSETSSPANTFSLNTLECPLEKGNAKERKYMAVVPSMPSKLDEYNGNQQLSI